jgi:dTDP-4-amino-4,6-dideoxygalactose transaminase
MVKPLWRVPYLGLPLQFKNLEKELTAEFKRVMGSGEFILRDDVDKFERNMASYLGVKHVIGVNSGTDALYLGAEAVGINSDDEVITVAHSFVATVAAITRRGAKPVFVDICEDFNMNTDEVENHVNARTKAILPVHLNGRVCNMDNLEKIARKYGLKIIEDAAQAIGARYQGKMAGSFGEIGCFSLHPMKTLSCAGDGGFISTNNDDTAERIRKLRNHGQKEKGEFLCFGSSSRLDNLQAAILNVKFSHLNEYISKRREIASKYSTALLGLPLKLPPKPDDGEHFDTYNSYVIRTKRRDELKEYLKENGIEVFVSIPKPLYSHQGLKLENNELKNNQKICLESLSLPIFPEMKDKEIKYVGDCICNFF